MEPLLELQGKRRLRKLAAVGFLWALVLFGRLTYLQVYRHDHYARLAVLQSNRRIAIPARRGRILDRTGQRLAISVPADTVVINPRHIGDLALAHDLLCKTLGLDAREFRRRLERAVARHRGYLRVKARISPEESRRLRSLKLDWIELYPDSRRYYPAGALAASVVGTVDYREQGASGLEWKLNAVLQGTPGVLQVLRDARLQTVRSRVLIRPRPGADVTVSIDERIQFVADQALQQAAAEFHCPTGSVVVMNPRNGEILAMSSYPGFDPNRRVRSAAALSTRTNQAISVPFEPGSVFKVVTLSAALETTDLTPETRIHCGPGVMTFFGRRIHDTHAHGTLSMAMVLAKSSNIGAIQIGLRVGARRLLEYVRRFGFGRRTGIELPGESPGKVWDLSQWRRTSIASVSMGHEISATTLQLARAVSVIANGGLLVRPRVVLWSQRPGGRRVMEPVSPPVRVLQPETAITMRRMMEGVVLHGTGRRASLRGYSCGGKTGSAQIFDFKTHRYTHNYNASFVGFAPVQDPQVVVAVTLNGARKYAAYVAAPVFRQVAETALRILGVRPDVPYRAPLPPLAPSEAGDVAIAGLGGPPPVPEKTKNEPVPPASGPVVSPYLVGPRVPDFRGQSLRAVLRETSRLGVRVAYVGHGVVRAQYPPPGAVLPAGGEVRIEFAR